MFLPVAALVLGIAGFVGPHPLAAHFPQQSVLVGRVEVREAASGWVGVEFRKLVVADTARVMISSVFPGGPADRAGLRSGDRVLKVNGALVSFAIMESVGPRIEPGDPYTFTVLRGDEVLEIPLTAEKRPESAEIIVTRMQTQLDTMRKLIGVTLDSLQVSEYSGFPVLEVRPIEQRDGSVTFTVSTAEGTFTVSDARIPADDVTWADSDHFATAWVLRDSTRVLPPVPYAPVEATASVTRRATPEDLRRIEAEARAAVAGRMQSRGEGLTISGSLSPWTEGARRIAGAELHPVGADLGRYLGVGRGLLIVDVTPGTPAARSGLLPGDVVLTADDTPIESLADLREVLAIPATTNVLGVHRRGSVVEIDLRR
jgi:predicted metalloprotease with PDZ domain